MPTLAPPTLLRRALAAAVLALVVWGVPGRVEALPGDPDTGFGVGGRLRVRRTFAPAVTVPAVQYPDGSFVLVVSPELQRYTAAGVLDPTFGAGGVVDLGYNPITLLVLPDGRLIVASRGAPSTALRLERRNLDGSLDATFGDAGSVIEDTPGLVVALARQPSDGAILVMGFRTNSGSFAGRFTADGILDATFSGGFVALSEPDASSDGGLGVQSTGRIVLAVRGGLAGLLPDGTLDPSFGDGGVLLDESFTALAVQADDTMYASMTARGECPPCGRDLVRLLPDGTRDASFGVAGVVERAGPNVVVLADGRIVAEDREFVTRFLPDGTVDPTFPARIGVRNIEATRLLSLADGRILVAGGPDVVAVFGNTCGDGTPEPGEDCDDGNLDDGDGCDAHCCSADTDGDGRCDSLDPCTGGRPLEKATIKITGTGKRNLAMTGTYRAPGSLTPALDPVTTGFRIVVDGAYQSVMDFIVPPGAFDPSSGAGWSVKNGRFIWKGPPNENAFQIEQVELKNRSTPAAAMVQVKLRGKFLFYGQDDGGNNYERFTEPGALPPSVTFVFDAPMAAGGQCGTATFPGPAPLPRCTVRDNGGAPDQLSCK